jgi:hypothetical protein
MRSQFKRGPDCLTCDRQQTRAGHCAAFVRQRTARLLDYPVSPVAPGLRCTPFCAEITRTPPWLASRVTPLCPGGAGGGGGRIADDRRPSHPIIDRSAAEGEITEAGA